MHAISISTQETTLGQQYLNQCQQILWKCNDQYPGGNAAISSSAYMKWSWKSKNESNVCNYVSGVLHKKLTDSRQMNGQAHTSLSPLSLSLSPI